MFLWNIAVTSLAEVWIEMATCVPYHAAKGVTSLAEVWIEILQRKTGKNALRTSLPLRKCGLKFYSILIWVTEWCHFPCGSVD